MNPRPSQLLRYALVLALLGLMPACGSDPTSDCESQPKGCVPGENPGDTDGGQNSGGTDAGQDPGSLPDGGTALVLTQFTAYYNRKGIERVPRDFTASPVELITYDGGTPLTLQGTVVDPGRIRFDVPPGTYLLKNSLDRYVVTSSRSVDLGARRFGRPNRGGNEVPLVDFTYPARLELSGLEPVPAAPSWSRLEFNSMDLEDYGEFELSKPLTAGQTSVLDTDAGYGSDWGSIPRFDPAQGDTAWVLQVSSGDAGTPAGAGLPWAFSSVVRAAHLNPFSFDGGAFSVQATLQPLPPQEVAFDWRRDEFDALRIASTSSVAGAPAPSPTASFHIYPVLQDARDGYIDISLSALLSFRIPGRDAQTPLVRRFSYGNPYPSAWVPVGQFINTYNFSVANHDGSRIVRTSERFMVSAPVSQLVAAPIRPLISLPRNLRVDGTSALTGQRLATTTPLVTWEPPTLGSATGYSLHVMQPDETNFLATTVARIDMGPEQRSLRIPPGVLTSGSDSVLRLTAHLAPGVAPEQVNFRYVLPSASAITSSAVLTAP
jgi:hypothetical protein